MSDVRRLPVGEDNEARVTLDELAREGACRMIAAALEAEVDDYVSSFTDEALTEAQRILRPGGTFILLFDVDHAPTATEPHSLDLGEVQASLTAMKLVCQRHWDQPFGRDGHRVAIVTIKPVSE